MIARGSGEGAVERRVFRKYYKGHMDKTKEGEWKQGREVGLDGDGERKCRKL